MNKLTFQQLRKANTKRGIEWMGRKTTVNDMLFCATELAGEVGELCNAIKKLSRSQQGVVGGLTIDELFENLKEELGDVVICADRIGDAFEIDLGEAVYEKFNKTSKKYKLKTKIRTAK